MSARYREYSDYLNSAEWSALRTRKLDEHGRFCSTCKADNKPLHVHHSEYRNLYDCTTADLVVLCEECHDDLHYFCKRFRVDYKGHDAEWIADALANFRLMPAYTARKQRLRKRVELRANKVAHKPGTKSFVRTVKRAVKRCKRRGFTVEAVREMRDALNGLLTTITPSATATPIVPQIETKRKGNGYTRALLASVGVPWPPPKGWKKRLTTAQISALSSTRVG